MINMKICTQCNNENPDYANICSNCGYSFVQQDTVKKEVIKNNPENYTQQNVSNNLNTNHNVSQNNNYQQYSNPGQAYNNQRVIPQNKKSKAVGLILNIILVGLGYAYVGKWGEGIILLVVYILMWILGFMLFFPWIIALGLWVYSLIKTNDMIDKYNNGLPY